MSAPLSPAAWTRTRSVASRPGRGPGAPRRRSIRPGWWRLASARRLPRQRARPSERSSAGRGSCEGHLPEKLSGYSDVGARMSLSACNTADAADVAGEPLRPRDRLAAPQPDLPRAGVPAGSAARPADPRLPGRRRTRSGPWRGGCGAPATTRSDRGCEPTSTAPRRRDAARGAARGPRRASGRARRDRRPEPRRHVREGARKAPARARRGDRHARGTAAPRSRCIRSCSRRSGS